MQRLRWYLNLLAREIVFRTVCRHRQGAKPNILLFCARRGGSTWLLNTIAAHDGMRYVGQPFLTVLMSRWRHRVPDLAEAAAYTGPHQFRQIVHYEGDAERRFHVLADDIISGRLPIHPSLAFRTPHFHRVTDRIIFQMTAGAPLIEWFDEQFDIQTVVLFRHPIPTSLSYLADDPFRSHDCLDFLHHQWFTETVLSGEQVDLARRVLDEGSPLARQVLDWTLKMLMPFRAIQSDRHPDWLTLTYEQMVTEPTPVPEVLSRRLDLPDVESMRAQMQQPSRTVSVQTTRRVADVSYLLSRWRRDVPPEDEKMLLAIPHAFGIDLYETGRDTVAERYVL